MTDEVKLIAETAERVFEDLCTPALIAEVEAGKWPEQLWSAVRDIGLDRVLEFERAGGVGAGGPAAFAILHASGRYQTPIPIAETIVARRLAAVAGLEVPDGVLSIAEADGTAYLERTAGGWSAHGTIKRVPWARHAKALLIAFPNNDACARFGVVDASHARVAIQPADNAAGEPRDDIALDGVPCAIGDAETMVPLDRPVQVFGAFARAAQLAGAIESVLAQAVQYASERVQFGRPIAAFQAIQQQLAVLAGESVAARVATETAAASLPPAEAAFDAARWLFDVAVAKIRTGDAATQAASIAHAVHGAIGFTHEHRLHFATRRLWAWRADFGTESQWAAALGKAAIGVRASGFWPAVTAHHLPLELE